MPLQLSAEGARSSSVVDTAYDVTMPSRRREKPAYPGAPPGAPFVPVAQRGLRWVGRQLGANDDDGSRARLLSEFRWKWFAAGEFEWRRDVERAINEGLQQHLANNMPGWRWEMTYLPKVINLHEQVFLALFDNDGDLSKLKARAAFHRTQTKEHCIDRCAWSI